MSGRGEWNILLALPPRTIQSDQMMRGAMKCMDCGGVKPGETVLISTDTNKLRIAEALAGRLCRGGDPIIIMIPPVKTMGPSFLNPSSPLFGKPMFFCNLQPGRRPIPRRGWKPSRRANGDRRCVKLSRMLFASGYRCRLRGVRPSGPETGCGLGREQGNPDHFSAGHGSPGRSQGPAGAV